MKKTMLFLTLGTLVALAAVVPMATPSSSSQEVAFETELPPLGMEMTIAWRPLPGPIPGQTCGGNICGPGTYCCNPSCGTCTPFGSYCTQQVCNPTE